jgi:flagellar motility protein MotE (MotC chaperone)
MSAALELYAQLTEAPDEKTRARLIADAFDALEARFPHISDLATQGHVRESELRLQKEIKEVEARMTEMEGRLRTELKQVEVNLHQAMAAQTRWLLGGLAVLGAVFKLADLLIAP